MNSGNTANGGQNDSSQTFAITVTHVNQAPDLLPIPNSAILPVNATATATATVSGGTINTITITSGGNRLYKPARRSHSPAAAPPSPPRRRP